MPTYEYACRRCGAHFDEVRPMAESTYDAECPDCGSSARKVVTAPMVRGDAYDWSMENQGKGRRISQLDHDTDKPYYAKTRQSAIDEAHRRGLGVIKA